MDSQISSEVLYTAVINTAIAGDNVLVTAPPTGTYIAVDFVQVIPTTATTLQFFSGTPAGTALTGPYPLSQQQVVTDENVFQNVRGIMTCKDGQAFVMNNSSAVQCGGFVRYRLVGNN